MSSYYVDRDVYSDESSMENSNNNHQSDASSDCERLRALLPAYCLGVTDLMETQWVQLQLKHCPEVEAELEQYQAMMETMLHSALPLDPPKSLLGKIMAAAREDKSAEGPADDDTDDTG